MNDNNIILSRILQYFYIEYHLEDFHFHIKQLQNYTEYCYVELLPLFLNTTFDFYNNIFDCLIKYNIVFVLGITFYWSFSYKQSYNK